MSEAPRASAETGAGGVLEDAIRTVAAAAPSPSRGGLGRAESDYLDAILTLRSETSKLRLAEERGDGDGVRERHRETESAVSYERDGVLDAPTPVGLEKLERDVREESRADHDADPAASPRSPPSKRLCVSVAVDPLRLA